MKDSSFPRQSLDRAVAMAWRTFERAGRLQCRVFPAVPILFFGDLDRYWSSPLRILTVGLNPSLREFQDDYKRFPLARKVTARDADRYLDALSAYFREDPYSWFNKSFEPLLNGAGSSYYGEQPSCALHTDICSPVATDPTWGGLDPVAQRALGTDGGPLWHELVTALKPQVVVLSEAEKHLERIEYKALTERGPIGRSDATNPYVVDAWWYRIGKEPTVAHAIVVDLDESFPPHDSGEWPVQMSLRHGDLYDDRGG